MSYYKTKDVTTLEEANELVQQPIRKASGHGSGNLHYTNGRRAKKWNPVQYERTYGFKRWLKEVQRRAPANDGERFSVRLFSGSDRATKAATTLPNLVGEAVALAVEYPECPACRKNVKVRMEGICSDCFREGLEAFLEERADEAPDKYGDNEWTYQPEYRDWERETRAAYRETLMAGAGAA